MIIMIMMMMMIIIMMIIVTSWPRRGPPVAETASDTALTTGPSQERSRTTSATR